MNSGSPGVRGSMDTSTGVHRCAPNPVCVCRVGCKVLGTWSLWQWSSGTWEGDQAQGKGDRGLFLGGSVRA